MNKKLSSLLLLITLSITDAYLLAHPNLIGRVGIWVYKHDYIKSFPRALFTVMLLVGISLAICELLRRFVQPKLASICLTGLFLVGVIWIVYVYYTFSSFSYRITGKAFIYGAHLLPAILTGIYGRYLFKSIVPSGNKEISAV